MTGTMMCLLGKPNSSLSHVELSPDSAYGFSTCLEEMSLTEAPTLNVMVKKNCPYSFNTYILLFPQSLYIKGMTTNLLSPFQLRVFGIQINNTPLQHMEANQRTPDQHSIQVGDLHIPLELQGTMSGFTTRKPTTLEVTDESGANGIHVYMTSNASWDPHSQQSVNIESSL
jgi:hypothetical protein